jgi:hypothetical protein
MKDTMSKINEKRTARMRAHPIATLKAFVEAKTLSSAAAQYELDRRAAKDEAPRT